MRKPWSISTTVRNPDRIRGFLSVLSEFEGKDFNEENQIAFQIELIRNKLYKPNELTDKLQGYYDKPSMMTLKEAKEVFHLMTINSRILKEDSGIRGRTSVAPLCKMGFAVAKESLGEISITRFGRKFLKDDYDIGDIFLEHFYKWNLPNPYSGDFVEGFNINPFIATLHIISRINSEWSRLGHEPKGLSKEEFSIFVPTTTDYRDIDKTVKEIIELRKRLDGKNDPSEVKAIKEDFYMEKLNAFFGTTSEEAFRKNFSTLKDYGDNAIRYFRITRFFYVRGNGYYFDIEPRRTVEIDSLLKTFDGSAKSFRTLDEYVDYLEGDITYPWEEPDKLIEIIKQLQNEIIKLNKSLKLPESLITDKLDKIKSKEQLKKIISELRDKRAELYGKKEYATLQNVDEFDKFIEQISNIHKYESSKGKKSVRLEYLTSMLLHGVNHARKIKPNYPVGDNNEPTFTAPANMPDIECYYKEFDIVCEVTMLSSRDQWINEGQPVMRHLRDFEIKVKRSCYCLFVAPKIHRDTFNTFSISNNHGYEGRKQKIIPISLNEFVMLLKFISNRKRASKDVDETELRKILDEFYKNITAVDNINEWEEKLEKMIGGMV